MNRIFDYIIYGGSLSGCVMAVKKSRSGERVALVERRGFLGSDIAGTLRVYDKEYMSVAADCELQEVKGLFCDSDESIPELSEIKRRLLDWVEKNGVEVFFSLDACAVLFDQEERKIGGLLLGSKWGYFLLQGRHIIDAEVSSPIKRMVDGSTWMHEETAVMVSRIQLNMEALDLPAAALSELVEKLKNKWPGLTAKEKAEAGGIYYKISGIEKNEKQHAAYLEVRYPVEASENMGCMYQKGQEAVLHTLKLLQKTYPLAKIRPVLLAYEPFIREADYVKPVELVVGWPEQEGIEEQSKWYFRNRDLILERKDFELQDWEPCEKMLPLQKLVHKEKGGLPVLLQSDVVVAGGGTAGVAAAVGAAREGALTVVVECHNGFGGTQTYGGIPGYYFCHKNGFANQQKKCMEEYGLEASCEGRFLWYNHSLAEEGVCMWNGTAVCDVVKEGDTVTGVIVVRDGSWGIIRGNVVIDATGDGDLIDFADIQHHLGAADSGNVQDCGMHHYGGYGYNLDAVYQSKYEEVLRGMRMGHRLGKGTDFSPILTTREGRLFEGEYTLNMRDILLGESFADTIALGYTDNDPHGEMSSLLSYMGVTPYHGEGIRVEIPYRCCIPKGVKGLLAASKSISGEQDAAAYVRMAGDIQNRAYAIGTAAAMAALKKCDVREISVKTLRQKLYHVQILDAEVRQFDKAEGTQRTKNVEQGLKDLLDGMKRESRECFGKVLCLPKDIIVPVLKEAFVKEPDCMVLGMALAWFGEKEALSVLKKSLKQLAEQEDIDTYDDSNNIKPGNNLGGIMEETCDYWRINQLLTVFALLEEKDIKEDVVKLMERFTAGGVTMRNHNAYVARRWDLHKIPHFDRLRSLLLYISRVPIESYGEALQKLAERECLLGFLGDESVYDFHNKGEEDRCTGRQYQSACLELSVGECLFKCNNSKGREILERGLEDVHYILRKRAYHSLRGCR